MLRLEAIRLEQGAFTLSGDIELEACKIHAIMGPSGAGKSTLLSALGGFLMPSAGAIRWQGQDITHLRPAERPMAMVFQDNNLFGHLTAWQNVALGVAPNLRLNDTQKARVARALEIVGLGGLGERKPASLSGGQQGRVALARVMVQERPVLLLDEPFAALGPALRAEMLEEVKALAGQMGATVLMVTHLPRDAEQIADTIVVVEGGEVHAAMPTAALLANPPAALRAYLGTASPHTQP